MSANFLKLNSDKTEIIVFGTRQQLLKSSITSINVAGATVAIQNKPVRNLGVLFDSNLGMSDQVSSVIKSVSFQIRNIARIRRYLDHEATKKLVNSAVTSRLDYCNSLLTGIAGHLVKRLQKAQNSAACLVSGKGRFDHISETCKDLHWLPVAQRIDFKVALMTFKAIHGLSPVYIQELLTEQPCVRHSRHRENQLLLHIPKTKLPTGGDRSFSSYAPSLWNKIPAEIRASKNVETFKKQLKTHYFKQAFNL